eukprot:368024_1
MVSLIIFSIGIYLTICHGTTNFEWNSKEAVDTWFSKDLTPALTDFFNSSGGDVAITKFANAIKASDDFEEYVLDQAIVGKTTWMKFAAGLPTMVNSFEAYYDIDMWESRHVMASFFYIYTFIDGTKVTANGKITGIWNKNGELHRWIYFGKSGSMKAVLLKFGELAEIQSQKNDL